MSSGGPEAEETPFGAGTAAAFLAVADFSATPTSGQMPLMVAACLMLVLATGVLIVAVRKFSKCKSGGGTTPSDKPTQEPPVPVEGI